MAPFGKRTSTSEPPDPEQESRNIDLNLPTHIAALSAHMRGVADDASAVADVLKTRSSLADLILSKPDCCVLRNDDLSECFINKQADHRTTYRSYYYTMDVTKVDQRMQFDIARVISEATVINAIARQFLVGQMSTASWEFLKIYVDRVIATATYLSLSLETYPISSALLRPATDEQAIRAKMESSVMLFKDGLREAAQSMIMPDTIMHLLPHPTPQMVVEVERDFEEGQLFINGVYFPKDSVDKSMKSVISENSKLLNRPVHA
jgi:hypothetical protein